MDEDVLGSIPGYSTQNPGENIHHHHWVSNPHPKDTAAILLTADGRYQPIGVILGCWCTYTFIPKRSPKRMTTNLSAPLRNGTY